MSIHSTVTVIPRLNTVSLTPPRTPSYSTESSVTVRNLPCISLDTVPHITVSPYRTCPSASSGSARRIARAAPLRPTRAATIDDVWIYGRGTVGIPKSAHAFVFQAPFE